MPPGLSVGLPPELTGALTPDRAGRLPTDSGEVLVTGGPAPTELPEPCGPAPLELTEGAGAVAAAVTVVAADASGSLARCAALSVAVRRTEVTVVAEVATATFACTWRSAELASSAPRSHEAPRLPQPKLNVGVRPAGAAER